MKKLLNQIFDDLTLFKIIMIVVAILLIIKLNDISKNGRYKDAGDNLIIDTRTGNEYIMEYNPSNYFEPNFPYSHKQ